jgi:hypothetical protein
MASVYTEVKSNSLLMMTLHGVRTVLETELGISPLVIATDEMVKSEYARRGHTEYPYAHLELNELMGVKDQGSNRTLQRQGFLTGLHGATKATTRKGFMFPITVGMTLKYTHGDPYEYITMAETLVILSLIGGLAFEIRLNEDFKFLVRVEVPEQTAIALASINTPESPGAVEIEAALIIHTQAGFFRDVAAVNSGRPTIRMEIEVQSH